jgi:hypothetical protein
MTVESLIGAMVDATEVETFDGQNHIRAIFLLCYENPSVIDTSKASVLGSYLKQQPANVR